MEAAATAAVEAGAAAAVAGFEPLSGEGLGLGGGIPQGTAAETGRMDVGGVMEPASSAAATTAMATTGAAPESQGASAHPTADIGAAAAPGAEVMDVDVHIGNDVLKP
ncbi:unnamed protein product [Ectocarpus sp. 12 AP-2014]